MKQDVHNKGCLLLSHLATLAEARCAFCKLVLKKFTGQSPVNSTACGQGEDNLVVW
jgi:hypothetical protein